ncbi:MAG TPA: peptide ABC transporter substrate-binding protein [Tetragenococcus sp.]|nr:peptide ABC transporter substrate-binding protein [Tetragenococcus sp.]
MNRLSKKTFNCFVLICGLLLSGCQSTGKNAEQKDSATKQEINIVFDSEMGTADISQATDFYSFITLNNAYEGLYRLDGKNQPVLAEAKEKANVSEDGLTYTIKIREDAKWSNGDSVTADDYVYSWQRTVDPDTAAGYANMFDPVKNAKDIREGKTDKEKLGVEAVNDHELKITLEKPTVYFEALLAFPTYFPQNEKIVEKYGDKYALTSKNAVYNGPFLLTDFSGAGTDNAWGLKKNDKYWDAKSVKLTTINFNVVKDSTTSLNLFESGEADDVTLSGEIARQKKNDKNFVSQTGGTTQYLEINQKAEDSPFRNKNFRKAISMAIDRKKMVESVIGDGSEVANGVVPAKIGTNPDTGKDFVDDVNSTLSYDKDQAQEYWNKAKEELGVDKLSIDLLASDTDQSKKTCEFLQGSLEQNLPDLEVNVTNVPLSIRLDRSDNGKFDMVMNNWLGEYPDPTNFLKLFTSDSSYNRGHWVNEEYDQYVDDALNKNANDPAARWQDMIAAEKIMDEELGVIPLYQVAGAHLHSQRFKGQVYHSVGAGYDYKYAYVEE